MEHSEEVLDVIFNNQLHVEQNNWNVAEQYKTLPLDKLKEIQLNKSFPYSVATINIEKGLNIGSMIRTAVLFGAEKFYIIGKRRWDKRSTVGAHNYIEIVHIDENVFDDDFNPNRLHQQLDYGNLLLVEQNGQPYTDITKDFIEYHKPVVIFGNENQGLPMAFINYARLMNMPIVSIPQYGIMRSLNVSVASGIICNKIAEECSKS